MQNTPDTLFPRWKTALAAPCSTCLPLGFRPLRPTPAANSYVEGTLSAHSALSAHIFQHAQGGLLSLLSLLSTIFMHTKPRKDTPSRRSTDPIDLCCESHS